MDNYYLVINLGLKSIRAIVFNELGNQIYVNSLKVITSLMGKNVEQDPNEWFKHLNELMQEIKEKTLLAKKIKYITATASSSCIFGVNKGGRPTTKVMMVSDRRSEDQVKIINTNPIFIKNASNHGYKCSTSSTIPKILWVRENDNDSYSYTHKWIGAVEFINFFFTNEFITDPLNASKSFFNGRDYDTEILSELNIDKTLLPNVVEIGTIFDINKSKKNELGLSNDCRFVVTTYDAICAVIGSYDGVATTACDVSGTVTSLRVLTTDHIKVDVESVLLCQELGIENKRLVGASNNLGGGIIEWAKQAFYNENSKDVYFSMENNAKLSSIGSNGIIFLPYLLGERAPFRSLTAKATFFGISRFSGIEDLTRAVFESTAFVTNDLLTLISDSGLNVDSISVSGGLAQFDVVNQIKADVTNKTIKVLENFESTSVGAFILLSLSIKKYSTIVEACKSTVRLRKVIYPSSGNHEIYKSHFELYKNLNSQLLDIYDQHSQILKKIERFSSETLSNL